MADAERSGTLEGCSVLIAEDQFLIADDLCETVTSLGGHVLGPVATVSAARQLLAQSRPDIAILDVDLQGERIDPIADALRAAGVPFVFATGFDAALLGDRYAGVPRVDKPISMAALERILLRLREPPSILQPP